jgi:hypothetical protein
MENSCCQIGIDFAAVKLGYLSFDTQRVKATQRFANYWIVRDRG